MDRLEHELRDVLTHERHALRSELVNLEAVYAGAARRRRRRTSVVAAAGAVVLVALAVPVSQLLLDDGQSQQRVESAKSDAPTSDTKMSTAARPLGPAWDDSAVMSVTATSERAFVVLGSPQGCLPEPCLRLAQTNDGGGSFTPLAIPKDAVAGVGDPTTSSVIDVRFGSATDGWLFGDGLWSTHDGGASWTKPKLPGRVQRLEAASGTVWALVTPIAGGKPTSLWRSPVGRDDWTAVPDVSLTYDVYLTVQGQHVVALGGHTSSAWVGDRGKFRKVDNPCDGGQFASLSATGSVWTRCMTGTAARLFTSPDGAAWRRVEPSFLPDSLPNNTVVGARTATDAVLSLGPNEPFYRIQSDGSGAAVKQSPNGGDTGYIGFTSGKIGYAITDNKLWRTEDGGDTWDRVRIG